MVIPNFMVYPGSLPSELRSHFTIIHHFPLQTAMNDQRCPLTSSPQVQSRISAPLLPGLQGSEGLGNMCPRAKWQVLQVM